MLKVVRQVLKVSKVQEDSTETQAIQVLKEALEDKVHKETKELRGARVLQREHKVILVLKGLKVHKGDRVLKEQQEGKVLKAHKELKVLRVEHKVRRE